MHPDFGGDAKRVLKAVGRSLAIIEFGPERKDHRRQRELLPPAWLRAGRNQRQAPQSARRRRTPRTILTTRRSGPSSSVANAKTANTSSSARTEAKSGFAPPTIPSSARPGKRSRSSRSLPTSQPPNCWPPRTPRKVEAISRAQAVIEYSPDGTNPHGEREFPRSRRAIRSRNSKASIIACSSTRPTRSRPNTRSSGGS